MEFLVKNSRVTPIFIFGENEDKFGPFFPIVVEGEIGEELFLFEFVNVLFPLIEFLVNS